MTLPRGYRLKDTARIRRVVHLGRRFSMSEMSVSIIASPDSRSRAAVVVSKAIDKRASVRNKLRRWATEILRPILPRLSPSLDIVVHLSKGASTVGFSEFRSRLIALFQKVAPPR